MATQVPTEFGPLLTTREAAARMRVSRDFLTNLALREEIPSVKLGPPPGQRGGRRLFPASEIEAWIGRHLRAE